MGVKSGSDTGQQEQRGTVLLVSADRQLKGALRERLAAYGYTAQTVPSLEKAWEGLARKKVPAVLIDLDKVPPTEDRWLRQFLLSAVAPPLIGVSAKSEAAESALALGLPGFFKQPVDVDELHFFLQKRSAPPAVPRKVEAKSDTGTNALAELIGRSAPLREVHETVERLAPFSTTVLITGESGTGKELLARAIHFNSPRKDGPFVAVNCGAIPESLIESELFGHKRGAFTDASRDKPGLFEEAHGGTLFLDEVGELPAHLQVKLLRALQERRIRRVGDEALVDIDVRLVAATLRNLERDVQSGRFRGDLFYRLNVVSIELPPLRERADDIPILVDHLLHKLAARLGLPIPEIPAEVMGCLLSYHWRGNVRELENCLEHALVLSDSGVLTLDVLPEAVVKGGTGQKRFSAKRSAGNSEVLSIKKRVPELEAELIERALHSTRGNRTRAAKLLEISHRALLYKIKEYGLAEDSEAGGG